jgi:hypothetical protein
MPSTRLVGKMAEQRGVGNMNNFFRFVGKFYTKYLKPLPKPTRNIPYPGDAALAQLQVDIMSRFHEMDPEFRERYMEIMRKSI